MIVKAKYGRLLSDFMPNAVYEHPWEVTVTDGLVAIAQASFLDASPLYASKPFAEACGFRDRPLHPLVCLNLALSFSVHDVSEQAIAHLAYLDVRFPDAGHVGDTVTARSMVLDAKPSSSGDKGVVHVHTVLTNQDGRVLCSFRRKALIRSGSLKERPAQTWPSDRPAPGFQSVPSLPPSLSSPMTRLLPPPRMPRLFEAFSPGEVLCHQIGKTVGDSEHMQLTALFRNSHPLHFDELYAKVNSFAKTRVVYGGLVFGWIAALASRDLAGNAIWDLGYDQGAHPSAVVAGDTLYALTKVTALRPQGAFGEVEMRLVGVKNISATDVYDKYGDALFADELSKKSDKIAEKVFEITRTLCVRRA